MKSTTSTLNQNAEEKPSLNRNAWYRPLFSPEHGVYMVLFVSFLTGAAAAQYWNWDTTLALICAFCGFQAEHPLVLQIRQRRSYKPRFLFWGGVYGGLALAISLYLVLSVAHNGVTLVWIYLGAFIALVIDGISVWQRSQKSIQNELATFTAVCLSAPFAYTVSTGEFSTAELGLWIINTLFFSSTIFTLKLRKPTKDQSIEQITLQAGFYHLILLLIMVGLWGIGWVSLFTVSAVGIVLLKFALILWQQDWYRKAPIKYVAVIETLSALLFLGIVCISVLPVHLLAPF